MKARTAHPLIARPLIALAFAGLALGATGARADEAGSAFGCTGLVEDRTLPMIEGRDGMFFRLAQDIMMQRRYSDAAVDHVAALSRALETRGTQLILALVPTKAVTMPRLLPQTATALGFDFDTAVYVQREIQHRLRAAGVASVDLQPAMLHDGTDTPPFFGPDTHWNASGAEAAARAIASEIARDARYDSLPKSAFVTTDEGPVTVASGMRRIIQDRCTAKVPEAVTTQFITRAALPSNEPDAGDGLDIGLDIGLDAAALDIGLEAPALDIGLADTASDIGLDDATLDIGLNDAPLDIGLGATEGPGTYTPGESLPVAVVGTSFSDMTAVNFPGFIAQHSGLETVNYAITGGGLYAAITSYLTSDDFQTAPPAFLVWEAPVYLNPMNAGDQPLRELTAAASGLCTQPITTRAGGDGHSLVADLPGGLGADDTLYLDADTRALRAVSFRFATDTGRSRTKEIVRGDRDRLTGRFYMPLSGLGSDAPTSLTITTRTPLGPAPRLFTCTPTPT